MLLDHELESVVARTIDGAVLSASGNTYYLRKTAGTWIVDKDTMHWIA